MEPTTAQPGLRTFPDEIAEVTKRRDQEQQRSPVRQAQDSVPFADAIDQYWQEHVLPFAIPLHIGGLGTTPDVLQYVGEQALRCDAPMSHGVDRRDHSWKVQETAQQLFAEAVGADQVFFSTNGSSMNVRVAMMGVVGPGETLLIARNSHKSVAAGLVMSGACPVWLEPEFDDELEIAQVPTVDTVRAALDANPDAKAVFIVSPNFYGAAADVEAIARLCHEHKVPLVVDDAWGLDYLFSDHPDLPTSPLKLGADLVIGSLHKSMTGFTQTSALSVQGDLVDSDRLSLCFELERTTSVSALLSLSIDAARRQWVRDGAALGAQAVETAKYLRQLLADRVPELFVPSEERLARSSAVVKVDPTHVSIETHGIGLTGYQAADWLQDNEHVTLELMDHRRIMATIGQSHQREHAEQLVDALRRLVDAHQGSHGRGPGDAPGGRASGDVGERSGAEALGPGCLPMGRRLRTEQAVRPRDAFFGRTEKVPVADAVGRVTAEMITVYPPGVPVLMPGERITTDVLTYLRGVVAGGGFLEGAVDEYLNELRVVVEQ